MEGNTIKVSLDGRALIEIKGEERVESIVLGRNELVTDEHGWVSAKDTGDREADIETAVRWNIKAVTVVNNNGSGNQSKRGFDRVYGGTQTDQARELLHKAAKDAKKSVDIRNEAGERIIANRRRNGTAFWR